MGVTAAGYLFREQLIDRPDVFFGAGIRVEGEMRGRRSSGRKTLRPSDYRIEPLRPAEIDRRTRGTNYSP